MRTRTEWTPERDARLAELVAAGLLHREIAAKLNATPSATRGRASKLKIKSPHCKKRGQVEADFSPEAIAEMDAQYCDAVRKSLGSNDGRAK